MHFVRFPLTNNLSSPINQNCDSVASVAKEKSNLFLQLMQTTHRYFLKKEDRLKSRKAIDLLFAKGKSFSNFPFRICWQVVEGDAKLKAGFTASSKNFKKATDRNRIKRLMREAYRLQKKNLQEALILQNKSVHLFFIYTGKEVPAYEFVFEKTGNVLKRIIKLLDEAVE
jgi:ribonuclease P protein component